MKNLILALITATFLFSGCAPSSSGGGGGTPVTPMVMDDDPEVLDEIPGDPEPEVDDRIIEVDGVKYVRYYVQAPADNFEIDTIIGTGTSKYVVFAEFQSPAPEGYTTATWYEQENDYSPQIVSHIVDGDTQEILDKYGYEGTAENVNVVVLDVTVEDFGGEQYLEDRYYVKQLRVGGTQVVIKFKAMDADYAAALTPFTLIEFQSNSFQLVLDDVGTTTHHYILESSDGAVSDLFYTFGSHHGVVSDQKVITDRDEIVRIYGYGGTVEHLIGVSFTLTVTSDVSLGLYVNHGGGIDAEWSISYTAPVVDDPADDTHVVTIDLDTLTILPYSSENYQYLDLYLNDPASTYLFIADIADLSTLDTDLENHIGVSTDITVIDADDLDDYRYDGSTTDVVGILINIGAITQSFDNSGHGSNIIVQTTSSSNSQLTRQLFPRFVAGDRPSGVAVVEDEENIVEEYPTNTIKIVDVEANSNNDRVVLNAYGMSQVLFMKSHDESLDFDSEIEHTGDITSHRVVSDHAELVALGWQGSTTDKVGVLVDILHVGQGGSTGSILITHRTPGEAHSFTTRLSVVTSDTDSTFAGITPKVYEVDRETTTATASIFDDSGLTRHLFVVRSLGGVTELSSSDSDIVVGHIEGVTFVPASNLEGFGYNGYTNGKLGILIDVDAPDAQTVYEDARNIQFYFGGSFVDLRIEIRVLPAVDGDITVQTGTDLSVDNGVSYHLIVQNLGVGWIRANDAQNGMFTIIRRILTRDASDLRAYGYTETITNTDSSRTIGALYKLTLTDSANAGEVSISTVCDASTLCTVGEDTGIVEIKVNGGTPVPLTIHDYSTQSYQNNHRFPALDVDETSGTTQHLFIVQRYGDGAVSVNQQSSDNDYISDVSFVNVGTLRSDYDYTGNSNGVVGVLFTVTAEEISEASRTDWIRLRYLYGGYVPFYIDVNVNNVN